jgi:hypothetical protein
MGEVEVIKYNLEIDTSEESSDLLYGILEDLS